MKLQAKHIDDERFLKAVKKLRQGTLGASSWALAEYLDIPVKVVRAKARRLINRGLLTGCAAHDCRGDFNVRT